MIDFCVIDIQGFIVDSNFVPKELSIGCSSNEELYSYLFKPIKPFKYLSAFEKKQVLWLEKNHHNIPYSEGHIYVSELKNILSLFNSYKTIFVKGHIKVDFLKDILPVKTNIINLEHDNNENCVSLKVFQTTCIYHKNNYGICSVHNVKLLMKYVKNVLSLNNKNVYNMYNITFIT